MMATDPVPENGSDGNDPRRDRFQALVEMTSDWLWEMDAAGRYTYCNPRCRDLLGYGPEEMLGRTPFALMPPGEAARAGTEFGAIVAERRAFSGLINIILREDGSEAVLETSGVPLLGPAGELLGYRGVGRDVTERHRTYLELKELARQLQRERDRSEKAGCAKSRFLAVMSHELRTPLNAVIGFSEVMLQEAYGPLGHPQYREFMDEIHRSGAHLLAVVNDILEHTKLEAGGVELEEGMASVEDMLRGTVAVLRPLARSRGVGVALDVPEAFPWLLCDERRLQQALVNLGRNAVRFSDAGAWVVLKAMLLPDGTPAIRIEDSGPGMSLDETALAMMPFGQVGDGLDRPTEGTGLGLPIAARLVELHGGALSIDSARGQGTSVTITLPGRARSWTAIALAVPPAQLAG